MINFSLMGAGRIGKMHAKFIAAHPNAKLKYIYDVNSQFAEEVAKSTILTEGRGKEGIERVVNDPRVAEIYMGG
jgi:predicted dehydrogenase